MQRRGAARRRAALYPALRLEALHEPHRARLREPERAAQLLVWRLANVPISTVSTYAYVNPVVAVVLGWALLDEEITAAMAAGAVAVLASVVLIVRDRPRGARSDTSRSRS